MPKRHSVKKKEGPSDDDSNRLRIMFSLIHADNSLTLSEIAKETELPANLVFYHLKELKSQYLVLEVDEKRYQCQPILHEDESEDLDALMILLIKQLARSIVIEDEPTEKMLAEAVMNNLKMYQEIFELELV